MTQKLLPKEPEQQKLTIRAPRPPRGWTWADLLERIGEEKAAGYRRKEIAAMQLWKKACNGDLRAIEMIMNRMEGLPGQNLITGNGGDQTLVLIKNIIEDSKKQLKGENVGVTDIQDSELVQGERETADLERGPEGNL